MPALSKPVAQGLAKLRKANGKTILLKTAVADELKALGYAVKGDRSIPLKDGFSRVRLKT